MSVGLLFTVCLLTHYLLFPLVDSALYATGYLLLHLLSIDWLVSRVFQSRSGCWRGNWLTYYLHHPLQLLTSCLRCWGRGFLDDTNPWTTYYSIRGLRWVPYFCYYRRGSLHGHLRPDTPTNWTRRLRRRSALQHGVE